MLLRFRIFLRNDNTYYHNPNVLQSRLKGLFGYTMFKNFIQIRLSFVMRNYAAINGTTAERIQWAYKYKRRILFSDSKRNFEV